jgi:hypothetical protein
MTDLEAFVVAMITLLLLVWPSVRLGVDESVDQRSKVKKQIRNLESIDNVIAIH